MAWSCSMQTSRSNVIEGVGQEFYFIVAAVLGGCLLTGGFGSAIGAALGCLILGMTQQGIVIAGWDDNLYFLFLGVIFITHNLHHAYLVGDRFLVLKRGRSIGNFARDDITLEGLTGLMSGGSELNELEHELQSTSSGRKLSQEN
jgi:hypothetical protein